MSSINERYTKVATFFERQETTRNLILPDALELVDPGQVAFPDHDVRQPGVVQTLSDAGAVKLERHRDEIEVGVRRRYRRRLVDVSRQLPEQPQLVVVAEVLVLEVGQVEPGQLALQRVSELFDLLHRVPETFL